MLYDWLAQIIGYIHTGTQTQNSTIIGIACFMAVMLFIISIDIFINGLFSFFRRKK